MQQTVHFSLIYSPMAGGMCCLSLVPRDPGSFHLLALSSWWISSWPGSEGEERTQSAGRRVWMWGHRFCP